MPVLLLCYGDPQAKDMLRRAIEARYGASPPAIEHLTIDFEGRTRVKVGPVKTWVPLDVKAHFTFPNHMRIEFVAKPMGMPVRRGMDAFDGDTYRSLRGGTEPHEVIEDEMIESARRRLWTMAAILLTPLSERFIRLDAPEGRTFTAVNTVLNDAVLIALREDNRVAYVQVECLNPDTQQRQTHTLRLTDEQQPVDDLMLPETISAYWDDEVAFEMSPKRVDRETDLPQSLFTLADVGS